MTKKFTAKDKIKYFVGVKHHLKEGNRVTLSYSAQASTGEVATTVKTWKAFKTTVKQLNKENIDYYITLHAGKYKLLAELFHLVDAVDNESLRYDIEHKLHDLINYL
jgi:hypothetical protein